MVVEEVCGAVEADRGLAGARTALHREHSRQRRADHLVLFELDRRDDVEHHAGARTLQLGQQRIAAAEVDSAEIGRAFTEHVVGDRQHLAGFDHEMAPTHEAAFVARARLIEGLGDGRTPLHHHRVGALVLDMATTDVPVLAVGFVDPSEQQRTRRVAEAARSGGGSRPRGRDPGSHRWP